MVVTKREFQDVVEQMNAILTKLDKRISELEKAKTTTRAKSQAKDLTNE